METAQKQRTLKSYGVELKGLEMKYDSSNSMLTPCTLLERDGPSFILFSLELTTALYDGQPGARKSFQVLQNGWVWNDTFQVVHDGIEGVLPLITK